MLDELNRTLLVVAVLGVAAVFATGFWLTNLGGGVGGEATGGNVDPNDWGAAANAICDDTNAEVVEIDQSLGPESTPAEALERGARILARRADSLEALPAPAGRANMAAALVAEMREAHAVMERVRDAVLREDFEQADRLAAGLESDELTRLAYELDVPWCDLFGADDATIRTSAAVNVLSVQELLELHHGETGSYAGADLGALRDDYGTDFGPGEATIARADAAGYCVESTVGYLTLHLTGPDPSEPTPGPC